MNTLAESLILSTSKTSTHQAKEILHSILLGAIQGFTEFLPVSSSGHLSLMEYFLHIKTNILLLNILLHLATMIAIIIYYRRQIYHILQELKRILPIGKSKTDGTGKAKLFLKIALADCVTFTVAIFLLQTVEETSKNPYLIGIFFIITAIMLIMTGVASSGKREISFPMAIVIGLFQAIAALPGISRSGATIFAALLGTRNRKEAVEFSFLIAIPVIGGAAGLQLVKGFHQLKDSGMLLLLPGFVVAFLTGYVSIYMIEKMTVKGFLQWFAIYLVPVGIILIIIS